MNTVTPISIKAIDAGSILDSRGFPTVQVDLTLDDDIAFSAAAPAGASTGAFEAVEVRDGGPAFSGRGVRRAVANVKGEISQLLSGKQWDTIRGVDDALIALDGTGNLSRLGANAVVAVSIAAARAFSFASGQSLHSWIASETSSAELLPVPHFNVLNGGAHAANALDFQEFMIAPLGASTELEAVQVGAETYHALAARIRDRYSTTGLGDEGGFAPPIDNPEDALDLLVEAIEDAGHSPSLSDVAIALDPAANGFYDGDGRYRIGERTLTRADLVAYYIELLERYPIRSIEDGFAEDDHEGWQALMSAVGDSVQLVGDDLYVTDAQRIRDGATSGYSNAALIKPNQIGTVSGTFDAISAARENAMASMISHRSGETVDTFIADLAVGTGAGQIKSGAPARGERVSKYNRLTEIEAEPGILRFGLV